MQKQDLLNKITEIGSCEDDVQRRELLSQLSDEASKDYDEMETLRTSNKTLTENNESLRDANMKLFLRIGADKTDDEQQEDKTGVKGKEKESLKFDDLFDEKGGIK